jgi:transposase-like protein
MPHRLGESPKFDRSAFAGYRFPPDVILLAVRWYLRYRLSYRDVAELLAERGIDVDHVTIYRWVIRFTPPLIDAARPCRHRVGDRWHVDETYVSVAGEWRYVYRAVDQYGRVVDVFVSPRRDAPAREAVLPQGDPGGGCPAGRSGDRQGQHVPCRYRRGASRGVPQRCEARQQCN